MQLSASCLSAVDVRGTAFLINSAQPVNHSKPVSLRYHRSSDLSSSIQQFVFDRYTAMDGGVTSSILNLEVTFGSLCSYRSSPVCQIELIFKRLIVH